MASSMRLAWGLSLVTVAASAEQGSSAEQGHFTRYMKHYLPPGDYKYAGKWSGDKAQWRDYVDSYADGMANYTGYLDKYGGKQANYQQYVDEYSSMAGASPTSGQGWQGDRGSQLRAWNRSMSRTMDQYVPKDYQSFGDKAMQARAGSGGNGASSPMEMQSQGGRENASSPAVSGYAQYMQGYAGDYQKYMQGGNYQQYIDKYAGGYGQGGQGGNGSFNQYMHTYADKYMHNYAGDYQKYMNYGQYVHKYAGNYYGGGGGGSPSKHHAEHPAHKAENKSKHEARKGEEAPRNRTAMLPNGSAAAAAEAQLELASEAPLELAAAANVTQLRLDAFEAAQQIEAFEQEARQSVQDVRSEAERTAAQRAEAVVDEQKRALGNVMTAFHNCSEAPAECVRRARKAVKELRKAGRQSLREAEKNMTRAAREYAHQRDDQVRHMAREVRRRTDALARAAPESRELADHLDRHAEDLADKAERTIEKLARAREEAVRHHIKSAEKRLDQEVKVPEALLEQAHAEGSEAAAPAAVVLVEGTPRGEEPNVTQLRSDVEEMVGRIEAFEQDLKRTAGDKAGVKESAEANAEAVVQEKLQALRSVMASFRNCTEASRRTCAERARRAIEELQHQGVRSLRSQSEAASAAARHTAMEAQRTVRGLAAEVRKRSDILARAAHESREVADYADRAERRAEDAAAQAERHIEKLARMREEASRHQCDEAEHRLKKELQEGKPAAAHFLAPATSAQPQTPASGAPWAGLLAAAAVVAALVGHAAMRRRRRVPAVLMPDELLG